MKEDLTSHGNVVNFGSLEQDSSWLALFKCFSVYIF